MFSLLGNGLVRIPEVGIYTWIKTALRSMSNRRRRILNGTDYLKGKSGYAGRIRTKKLAPCRK